MHIFQIIPIYNKIINLKNILVIDKLKSYSYYITESLWSGSSTGVIIIAYSMATINQRYYYVILMYDYYQADENILNTG